MKRFLLLWWLPLLACAEEPAFTEPFAGPLSSGWSWVREEKGAWRTGERGLELRVLPGNLWGPPNNVKNVLVRPAPKPEDGPIEISVAIENTPTHQYEQANLAWYYDDSHMVKLGLELVDREICIVMGREQADRTRTLAKIPVAATSVCVRLQIDRQQIVGHYRVAGANEWIEAGRGDLPVPAGGQARISLHAYQGAPDVEHWARFSAFRVEQRKRSSP